MNNLRSKIESEIKSYNFKHSSSEFAMSGLIEPKTISCSDQISDNIEDYTLVFVEGDGNGYQVVYDNEIDEFGLAIKNKIGGYTFIGYYGTFCKTIDSM